MSNDVRQRMVEGAANLLARKGVQGASFSEIIAATNAPRGSIYHHFPGGKTQLLQAAIDHLALEALKPLETIAGASAEAVTMAYLDLWRVILMRSELQAGCAILAVTVTSDIPELVNQAAAAFRTWRTRIAALLEQGGMEQDEASGFALTLIAATQGALVFSRAEKSLKPFDDVAEMMRQQVHSRAPS